MILKLTNFIIDYKKNNSYILTLLYLNKVIYIFLMYGFLFELSNWLQYSRYRIIRLFGLTLNYNVIQFEKKINYTGNLFFYEIASNKYLKITDKLIENSKEINPEKTIEIIEDISFQNLEQLPVNLVLIFKLLSMSLFKVFFLFCDCISFNPIIWILNIFATFYTISSIIYYVLRNKVVFNLQNNLHNDNTDVSEHIEGVVYNINDLHYNGNKKEVINQHKIYHKSLSNNIDIYNENVSEFIKKNDRPIQNRLLFFNFFGLGTTYMIQTYKLLQQGFILIMRTMLLINRYFDNIAKFEKIAGYKSSIKKFSIKKFYLSNIKYRNNKLIEFNELNEVEFNNISYKIDGKYYIFKDIHFIIKGLFNCVSGVSGSGKSTLIRLILKINKLNNGKIIYKYENTESQICNIAYIPQFMVIYKGSIYDNIFYYKKNISENEKNLALDLIKLFKFDDIIFNLFKDKIDNGDTIDNCCRIPIFTRNNDILSGGQKQRLQIIRICIQSILQKKKLILTDELSSALDLKTAKIVWSSLKFFSYKYKIMFINFIHPNLFNEFKKLFDTKISINIKNNVRYFDKL